MTEPPDILSSFLDELKASLSQSAGDAVIRRINAERLLRLLVEEFIDSCQAERMRILSDNRLVGEAGADFLLQIDDYDVRVELLDAPEGAPTFDTAQLPRLVALLEDNPSTVALILAWATDDLLAVDLPLSQLRTVAEHPDRLKDLLANARPLPQVLQDVVAQHTKLWAVGLERASRPVTSPADLRRLFESAIGEAIEAEQRRSYRSAERRLAASEFPVEREKRLILDALAQALAGAEAQDLVPTLTRIKRGGKQ